MAYNKMPKKYVKETFAMIYGKNKNKQESFTLEYVTVYDVGGQVSSSLVRSSSNVIFTFTLDCNRL